MKKKYQKRLFALSIASMCVCCAALALAGIEYHQNLKLKAVVLQLSKQASVSQMAQIEKVFASRDQQLQESGKSLDFLNWKTMLQEQLRGAAFRLKFSAEALKQSRRNKELSALVHYTLGLSFTAAADFSAAKESFTQALKDDPRDAESAYNLGLLYSLSKQPTDTEKAIRYYRIYLELAPQGVRAEAVAEKIKQLE